ncbi:hypothetical protein CDAR_613171 [Caerostris darwini]|uniref:Uncharacterized protein n=1 Tax=Caerostris darwini TaxID=1538125 RepID=A0AAV4UKX0_9ARAC|nr:hypothetical protein CDAR_613171 [Caerostris darwini]
MSKGPTLINRNNAIVVYIESCTACSTQEESPSARARLEVCAGERSLVAQIRPTLCPPRGPYTAVGESRRPGEQPASSFSCHPFSLAVSRTFDTLRRTNGPKILFISLDVAAMFGVYRRYYTKLIF